MNRVSSLSLVVANLIVALVVVSQRWGYYSVLLIYWFEAVIIGMYGLFRMCLSCWLGNPLGERVGMSNGFSRLFLSAVLGGFFITKFGGFALATGVWVTLTPGFLAGGDASGGFTKIAEGLGAVGAGVMTAAAVLFVSHGVSFLLNFIGHSEYKRSNALVLLFKPYVRMALVLVVLAGGFAVTVAIPELYRTTGFAAGVILIKLVVDLASHAFEHRRRLSPEPNPAG